MSSATAAKVVVSFAAGFGHGPFGPDFSQAFLQADVANPNLLVDLLDLYFGVMAGEFGSGKRDAFGAASGKAGRLKRANYGLRDSPRFWARRSRCAHPAGESLRLQVGVERRKLSGGMPRR